MRRERARGLDLAACYVPVSLDGTRRPVLFRLESITVHVVDWVSRPHVVRHIVVAIELKNGFGFCL